MFDADNYWHSGFYEEVDWSGRGILYADQPCCLLALIRVVLLTRAFPQGQFLPPLFGLLFLSLSKIAASAVVESRYGSHEDEEYTRIELLCSTR